MPTVTGTVTTVAYAAPLSLNGVVTVTAASPSSPTPASSTTTATLHTLYNRAARAFILRDIPLTYSLIESAFEVLTPPLIIPDTLADHRRKWDILRITLESTVYTSPPASNDLMPKSLQENQIKTPQALLTGAYTRSLALFSPQNDHTNPNAAHLPPQVLITLIYSSLRVNCPEAGRIVIEEWLARRDVPIHFIQDAATKENNYEKVLELYCLHILPKLEQWDYAREFLEYEGELPTPIRDNLKRSLKALEAEVASSHRKSSFSPLSKPSIAEFSRSPSPTPSRSSSSSSLSTTSTSTVVPTSTRIRPRSRSRSRSRYTSAARNDSRTSTSSDLTATPSPRKSSHPVLRSYPAEPSSSRFSSPPRSTSQAAALRSSNMRIYPLLKAFLSPYLTVSNISAFFILFFAVPLLSLVVRARRRRTQTFATIANNAEVARRRLQANGNVGVVGKAWTAAIRVVLDTVRMAGSGLV